MRSVLRVQWLALIVLFGLLAGSLLPTAHNGAVGRSVSAAPVSVAGGAGMQAPAAQAAVDLTITQMEITQGVQSVDQLVDLVAGKRTFVRLYVKSLQGGNQTGVRARLYRMIGGVRQLPGLVPNNPNGKITVRTSPSRSQLNDSYYFQLPASWTATGNLQVQAELNPTPRAPVETTYTNNIRTETVTFLATPPVYLFQFNVRYKQDGVTYAASSTQMFELRDWLRRVYPMPYLKVSTYSLDMTALNRRPTCDEVNARLATIRNWVLAFMPGQHVSTRYYGMVSDGGGFMRGCSPGSTLKVGSGPTGSNTSRFTWDKNGISYGDWYGGHELGHAFGRPHATFCGAQGSQPYPYPNGIIGGPTGSTTRYYGFDIYLRDIVVYPGTWTDMMTYCPDEWISDFTYEAIRNRMVSENNAARAAAPRQQADLLVVSGLVDTASPTATLQTMYRINTNAEPTNVRLSEYAVRLRGTRNGLLAEYFITPHLSSEAEERGETVALINEMVPWVLGTLKIEIVKGDQLLTSRPVSNNAPQVQIVSPNGGETVNGDLAVTWTASDADGDPLRASVFLTTDTGGRRYVPLALDVAGNSVVIPAADLGGSPASRIKVVVTDGVNTAQDVSDAMFTMPNTAPTVNILTPATNTTVLISQTVALEADANDLEDDLQEGAYTWTSNLDGPLGTGSQLTLDTLRVGTHTLTVAVRDSGDQVTTDTVMITVTATETTPAQGLIVAPGHLAFAAAPTSTTTLTETLSIREAAPGVLNWTAQSSAPWLTLEATSGTTPSDPELRINPTGLAAGSYKATISVNGGAVGGASVAPQQIEVFLQIGELDEGLTTPNLFLPLIKR